MKTGHLGSSCVFAALLIGSIQTRGEILEIYPRQVVNGPDVLLKDIVRNPSLMPDEWGDRKVMPAPVPGKPTAFSIASIAYALQKYPDMNDVTLRGNVNVTIERASSTLPSEDVAEAIRRFVEKTAEWPEAAYHVECDPGARDIPVSNESSQIRIVRYAALDNMNNYRFTAGVVSGGSTNGTFDVDATVTPMQKVWAPGRALPRGHLIAQEDLTVQLVPSDPQKSFVPVDEPLEGMELCRSVPANQPILRYQLVYPLCAKPGELISVSTTRGPLHVALRARALATGRKGDRILCLNERSKRRLLVRLTDTKEATVDF